MQHKFKIAGLALAAALGVATPAPAHEPAPTGCQPAAPARYQDSGVVVWAQDAPNGYVDFVVCSRTTGRMVTALHFDNDCISPSGGCDDVHPEIRRVVRAGRWLAMYVDNEVSNAAIALADVRAGTTPRLDGYSPRGALRDLVLRRDGTLAWISGHLSKRFKRSRELRICDRACRTSGSRARRIARGRKLSGLRLKGRRVVWSDGKRTRSAPAR